MQSLFGGAPKEAIQRMGGQILIVDGFSGMVILGVMAYYHFVKSKKFDAQFWMLVVGAILGFVLGVSGWNLLSSIGDAVSSNL